MAVTKNIDEISAENKFATSCCVFPCTYFLIVASMMQQTRCISNAISGVAWAEGSTTDNVLSMHMGTIGVTYSKTT